MRVVVAIGVLVALGRSAIADVAIERVRVHVAPKKHNGDKWDRSPGADPDPKIVVLVDGERVQECPKRDDTFDADCALARRVVEEGSTIELRVDDEDLINDDTIGSARGTLVDRPGEQSLGVDGQLDGAWVTVSHVDGPSAGARLVMRLGARGIGALVGVALALLIAKLVGAKFLTPRRTDTTLQREAGTAERALRFWRSPILLASAAASALGGFLAVALKDPKLPLALASIPYVLGGFALTTPIIDAHAHEHLGQKRARLIAAGLAVMLAVPLFVFLGSLFEGLTFMVSHIGLVMIVVLLLCLV